MSKKNKIIVSIVGITIVLLALLGITYAYYLTRIEGNTNTNSISVTTANLKLSYSDGNEIVTQTNIMPGTTIGEKTFSVSNTGNSKVKNYKVVLEYAAIDGVVPSVFVRPEDFEITLTCVSKNIETNEESGTCNSYTGTWNNESFEMTLNDIDEGIKHEYSLTIYYANPDIDQSDDMGKNLNLKVQIYGENETSTITGTINNVDETYAMKLNSNPKISTIKNVGTEENPKYQYKFIGVEYNNKNDSHTLTLVDKNNVEQSTGNITINKGTNSNISGSTITVKDNQTNIYLNTNSGSSTLTNSATFNPYSNDTNSLTYHIINNAKGTIYRDVPLSKVAVETSAYGSGNFNITRYYYTSWEEGNYEWGGLTYGTTQGKADGSPDQIDDGIAPVQACESVIGKYIADHYCYYDGCDVIGKVVDCESDGTPILEETDNHASWEEGGYEWPGLTYGSSEGSAIGYPDEIYYGLEPLQACESVKGQYISDYYCYYEGCDSIGKVVDCESDGTPILEENYYENKVEIMLNEKVLSVAQDDLGISYYYRGNVEDNYVTFADMCWRIVRILGDGSTKLILEDRDQPCSTSIDGNWNIPTTTGGTIYEGNFGYTTHPVNTLTSSDGTKNSSEIRFMDYLHGQTESDKSMATAFKNFQNTFSGTELSKLKSGNWCLGDRAYSGTYASRIKGTYIYSLLNERQMLDYKIKATKFYYDSYVRLSGTSKDGYQPTLKCNGTLMNDWDDNANNPTPMYVGALTADEIVYAGGKVNKRYSNYYLINNYQKTQYKRFWSFSLTNYYLHGIWDNAYNVEGDGNLDNTYGVNFNYSFRPAVTLKAGTIITGGEGTIENPYIIDEN